MTKPIGTDGDVSCREPYVTAFNDCWTLNSHRKE